jgi:hypothetical protein
VEANVSDKRAVSIFMAEDKAQKIEDIVLYPKRRLQPTNQHDEETEKNII